MDMIILTVHDVTQHDNIEYFETQYGKQLWKKVNQEFLARTLVITKSKKQLFLYFTCSVSIVMFLDGTLYFKTLHILQYIVAPLHKM